MYLVMYTDNLCPNVLARNYIIHTITGERIYPFKEGLWFYDAYSAPDCSLYMGCNVEAAHLT